MIITHHMNKVCDLEDGFEYWKCPLCDQSQEIRFDPYKTRNLNFIYDLNIRHEIYNGRYRLLEIFPGDL